MTDQYYEHIAKAELKFSVITTIKTLNEMKASNDNKESSDAEYSVTRVSKIVIKL